MWTSIENGLRIDMDRNQACPFKKITFPNFQNHFCKVCSQCPSSYFDQKPSTGTANNIAEFKLFFHRLSFVVTHTSTEMMTKSPTLQKERFINIVSYVKVSVYLV